MRQKPMTRHVPAIIALLCFVAAPVWGQPARTGFPPGITPPVFVVPASAVNGAGLVTTSQLDFGVAGVRVSGDGDGAITFLGLGNGSDEDLTINLDDTANTAAWSSSTGLNTWNLPFHLLFTTDNTYDIGASGATRPRQIYAAGNVVVDGQVNSTGSITIAGGASLLLSGRTIISATAPTIASGFGTTPSLAAGNGTAAFTINVGTGGTASAGVITMAAATTGWNCHVDNRTGVAANRGDQRTVQTATTTTSVTVQNQTVSTGAALAWTASDVLAVMCMGY